MQTPPAIAILHTSPATVELFTGLLRERLPTARIFNLLDDSILPELRDNGGDVTAVSARWTTYAAIARDQGADVILNACSSIGELCEPVSREVGVRIVRVDAALARHAVTSGTRIAVVATLRSTLRPTADLLSATAAAMGRRATIDAVLADGAYEALMAGDRSLHDDRVAAALRAAAGAADVVVLAQASMARVLPRLSAEEQAKCVTSPALAADEVARIVHDAR